MAVSGLILFHGAGGDREHPLFLQLESALPVPVMRVNFPYREKGPGRRPPDRMPKLLEAVNAASESASEEWGVPQSEIALGGRSMGGRAASIAVAEGLEAAVLVLLSYPLHPPGKPEKLRVDHWPQVTVPVLFISAVSDPFGKPPDYDKHLPSLGGPHTEHWLPTGGHDPKKHHDEIVEVVSEYLVSG